MAKKWLNEKTTDGIKEIEGNFGKIKGTKWGNKILNLIGTIEVKLHVLEMLGKITRLLNQDLVHI